MRRSMGLLAVVLSATLLSAGLAQAQAPQGRVMNRKGTSRVKETQPTKPTAPVAETESAVVSRTHENLDVTPEEKQRAAALQKAAAAEEHQVSSQVRGLQALIQKEEQALAQRLAYAAQVRAQGLTKNDQKLLDQAEVIERQALDYYQKRVLQFERTRVSNGASSNQVRQPSRRVQQPTPAPQRSSQPSSTYKRSYSTSRYRSRR